MANVSQAQPRPIAYLVLLVHQPDISQSSIFKGKAERIAIKIAMILLPIIDGQLASLVIKYDSIIRLKLTDIIHGNAQMIGYACEKLYWFLCVSFRARALNRALSPIRRLITYTGQRNENVRGRQSHTIHYMPTYHAHGIHCKLHCAVQMWTNFKSTKYSYSAIILSQKYCWHYVLNRGPSAFAVPSAVVGCVITLSSAIDGICQRTYTHTYTHTHTRHHHRIDSLPAFGKESIKWTP